MKFQEQMEIRDVQPKTPKLLDFFTHRFGFKFETDTSMKSAEL